MGARPTVRRAPMVLGHNDKTAHELNRVSSDVSLSLFCGFGKYTYTKRFELLTLLSLELWRLHFDRV